MIWADEMKEPEAYRDNYEALLAHFGNKRLLTVSDVAEYTGRDRRFVKELYEIPRSGITIPTLARRMSR